MRNAKSIFSGRHIKFVALELPKPLPFDGVEFEAQGSMRYRSEIDAGALIRDAQAELYLSAPEQYKIFLLALFSGLRRGEIDALEWTAVDFDRALIRIEPTEFLHPKSDESAADVEIDPEVMEVLREFRSRSKGRFVVESTLAPRAEGACNRYRCQRWFQGLTRWLRLKGVRARSPIHSLRKEFGSIICSQYGIYSASRALRHSGISITAAHYLDRKRRTTLGLGKLLVRTDVGAGTKPSGDGIVKGRRRRGIQKP